MGANGSPRGPEQIHLREDVAGADETPTLPRRPGRTPLGNRERGCGAGRVHRRLYGALFCRCCFSARHREVLLALWPLLLVLAAALTIANLFRLRSESSLRAFLPLVLLAAIHGTFMSQQLWGSTYAIWPLLALLVAEMLAFLNGFLYGIREGHAARAASAWFVPALAALISVTLLVCGGFYTASEERLSYAYFPDGPPAHSPFPPLCPRGKEE